MRLLDPTPLCGCWTPHQVRLLEYSPKARGGGGHQQPCTDLVAADVGLCQQGGAGAVKAQGNVGTHVLAQRQQGAQVLDIERHVCGRQP